MNRKDKLYYDLIEAYRNHSCNDTLIDTYIYKVLKLVKDYLDFDNLKKENAELKEQLSYTKEELEGSQSAYEWSQTENSILKSENEELRSKYNDLMLDFKMFDFNTLKQENEKLKKTIENIKNKCISNTNLWLVVCSRNYEDYKSFVENKDHELVRIEHNILTQQEYDLLKEVLENE